ncbi:hypothetical protein N665_0422s0019 [Sinapis alba]|nr:hypothetical protein N665_0422s0019 [Sinapis alba]
MKMIMSIFFILSLVSPISFASFQDFCVADLNGPQYPSGYSCKNPDQVTANDFAFSGLAKAGNTSNMIKAAVATGFAPDFAGVNGLGVSVARLDLAEGGVVPIHIHSGASEVLIVIEGTIRAGIISSANKVYLKTLQKGDVMVFPQGLLHFALNGGTGPALAFAAFGSSNPGVQLVPHALFSNDLPSELVEATTFHSHEEIKRIKGVLGGTNLPSLSFY